jgi:hypothetical protein
MKVTGASFLLTFKCTAKCKHCSYRGAPTRANRHITLTDAIRWLTELTDTQPFDWLTVHGGEPFLFYDILKEIVQNAAKLGIPKVGVITNAYWATDLKTAKQALSELMDAGINRITVSIDAFHQEYIPLERAKTAIITASDLRFEKVWVDSYYINPITPSNSYDLKTIQTIDSLRDIHGVEFSGYPVGLAGRAADQLVDEVKMSKRTPSGKCTFPFWLGGDLKNPNVIEIDYEGNVTLCPGLCIGNAKETSLLDVLESYNYRTHPIIQILAEDGPIGLLNLVNSKGLKTSESFANECHLCYAMRRILRSEYPQFLAHRGCYHTDSSQLHNT